MNFTELKLDSRLLRAIADRGYEQTTDVQEQTLAKSLQGLDVAVQSQTGTGKTAAFLITIFERLLSMDASKGKKALIIAPTRELAIQIEKEARLLNRYLGFAIGCIFGGVPSAGQLAMLKKGLDVISGTPGRLLDLSRSGFLNLKEIGILVIDEADRLFDMGFLPDVRKLLQKMPPRDARQSMLFGATLNQASRRIIDEFLNHPVSIRLTPNQMTVETIHQELFHVKSHIKLNLVLGILKDQHPRNALIFTNMRHVAYRLSKKLQVNGFRTQCLTGDLPQSKRMKVMEDFKAGKFNYLIATDVAARGLQIDNLEMVINYDLPQDPENYVHRIGRTARAGNSGRAISFAGEDTFLHLAAIESFIGMPIPVREAGFELFATDESEGLPMRKSGGNGQARKNRAGFRSNSASRKRGWGRSPSFSTARP